MNSKVKYHPAIFIFT